MGGNVVSWERWGWKRGVKSFSEIDRERKARSEGEGGGREEEEQLSLDVCL